VTTLPHHSIEELEAGQKNPNRTAGSLGNGDKLEPLTMFSSFTAQMLDQIIINGLAHLLRCGTPSTPSTLLPGISVQKTEKWKNGVQVRSDGTLAQLCCGLFCEYRQMKMQAILSIKNEVRMLVLSVCWSGHKLIGSPCHHQPLPVKMILCSIFEGTLSDKKTGLKVRLQVYTLAVCMP
jgi:hypothetical protein